jgi:adenylate cyclase
MALEIERKYLVADDSWQEQVDSSSSIMQGYLASTARLTVRVRLRGDAAFLTIKGATTGVTRTEFEFPIDVADARAMLQTLATGPVIEKVRHIVPVGDHRWEVDVFAGDNEGLVLAEVELSSPQEHFVVPSWAGSEVSDDPRYFNVNLAQHPYRTWDEP